MKNGSTVTSLPKKGYRSAAIAIFILKTTIA